MDNLFSSSYKATIGAEFLSKDVALEDRIVSMQIWDTAGQEKFQSIQKVFYRGTDGCIIVFDLTNMKSFESLTKWREDFIQASGIVNVEKFPILIIGNKSDLKSERKVKNFRYLDLGYATKNFTMV